MTEKDVTLIERLRDAGVGDNDTDLFRKGLVALAVENGIEVPA
jgi:hypothetical protein